MAGSPEILAHGTNPTVHSLLGDSNAKAETKASRPNNGILDSFHGVNSMLFWQL
jgi:hypothetical protein